MNIVCPSVCVHLKQSTISINVLIHTCVRVLVCVCVLALLLAKSSEVKKDKDCEEEHPEQCIKGAYE